MKIHLNHWLFRLFALGMMVSVFSHCSKDFTTTPQTKQKQGRIIVVSDLHASSSHIIIGGAQIVVQAKLTDQNNEVAGGQPVHFSTTLGSITPVDTTNGRGLAHAILTSGLTPGAAIIKAQYKDEHSRTITVYFDSSGTSFFSFQAAPNSILANGVDSVSVVVKVLNNTGKPAKNSPVFFSANAGCFTSAIVYSDSMGAARNLFHSYPSRFDSTAVLTFRVNGMESQTSVALRGVEFHLTANPTFLIANSANQAEIRGILKESTSKIAIPSGIVTFSTTLGTIPWQGVTGDDGVVKVSLTSTTELGSARIIGTYGSGIRDTAYVDFIKSEPANLYVTVDKQALPADNASTAEIQVRITDVNNDPTADGLPVHFTIVR
ncbi:MAG TPA: hypothetical protein ENH29_03705, partial [Bacteroidetes bacterium]|nr:hypothetical protein [Bacteroidota bacterium]